MYIVPMNQFQLGRFKAWLGLHRFVEIIEYNVAPVSFKYCYLTNSVRKRAIVHYAIERDGEIILSAEAGKHYDEMLHGYRPSLKRGVAAKAHLLVREGRERYPKVQSAFTGDGVYAWRKKHVNNPCFYCELEMLEGEVTVEHLVPRSRGGTNHPANIRAAHASCNGRVGNMTLEAKARLYPQAFETVDMELLRYLQAHEWMDPDPNEIAPNWRDLWKEPWSLDNFRRNKDA